MDHFVLTGTPPTPPSVTAPTFPADSFIVTQGLEATYHVNVTLGGHASSNGGDGVPSKVLFDAGGKIRHRGSCVLTSNHYPVRGSRWGVGCMEWLH